MLIRYGWLIANYHRGFSPNSKLVIWLSGMPSIPDVSKDQDYVHFLAIWYDVVIPDYYGSFRSEGEFSPDWCLQTSIDTYNYFTAGWVTADCWSGEEITVHPYKNIVVVGSSFGAGFAIRTSIQIPQISSVGLISWAVKFADMNLIWYPEETMEDVQWVLYRGGLWNLYRSAETPSWNEFYQDQRWQSYNDIVQELSQNNVFIAHGGADDCVHVSRSRTLFDELNSLNPWWNHHYCEVPKGWHSWMTKQIAVVEFCKWLIWW